MEKDTKEDEAVCAFIKILSNFHKRQTAGQVKISETSLQTVIKAIKKRKDNLDIHNAEEVIAHKSCSLEYMSSEHISRHLKHKSNGKHMSLLQLSPLED